MKLKINKRRKLEMNKYVKINTLPNNQWVQEKIKKEVKKYLETNENGNEIYQTLWDGTNAVLRRKFIAINAYI